MASLPFVKIRMTDGWPSDAIYRPHMIWMGHGPDTKLAAFLAYR